ncbi:MAG: hypothetical protein ABI295_04855 [Xanthomarina sp.]
MKKPTKNLFAIIFLITISFTSCKSEKELTIENSFEDRDMIVQANLEKGIIAKLQFPESYEFVGLKLRDSVLFSDNINYLKNYHRQILEADKKNLESQELYKKEGSSRYVKEKVVELQSTISKNEKILLEIDRLSTELGAKVNQAASYTYDYSFKSKNVSGNDRSYEYIVQTSQAPEYKVIKVAESENMIILNPNDFPGYKEMIKTFE